MRQKKTREVQIDHPLEEVFGIEPLSTLVPVTESEMTAVESEMFDDKDKEIEGEIQEVYRLALDGYDAIVADIEGIEPKYRARNNEVAIQYLNTALDAAKQKMDLKKYKDVIRSKVVQSPKSGNTTNNVLVCDRNELLRMMKGGDK